jgi:protein LTV1
LPVIVPVTRPRLETTEERRERKKAVKEERKFRRSEKKATKMLFHSEQLRQERLNFNQRKTATVV